MKIKTLALLAALALASSGCTNLSHSITAKDGSQTTLKLTGFMSNKAVTSLSNGGTTAQTTKGLKLGAVTDDVSNPMAQMTELIKAIGEISAKGAAKTVAP